MEENQQQLFGLEVDQQAKSSFNEIIRWTRFIAIVGYVFTGLVVLLLAVAGATIANQFSSYFRINAEGGVVIIVVVLIAVAVVCLWLYFLLKASNFIKKGLLSSDQKIFNEGLASLKTYFMIGSVLAILSLITNLINLF